jgi:DEAD/DEAH box helicase domain-containing protein
VRQGRLDLVEQYCHEDVEVRRDLYLHDRREGCVTDKRRRTTLRLRVEW